MDTPFVKFMARALALALFTALIIATPVSAVATTPKVLRVLLLGESYMAGNGARNTTASGYAMDFYGPDLCFRSKANWAEQWAKAYTQRTGTPVYLENHACAGAVAKDYFHSRNDRPDVSQDPVGTSGYFFASELPYTSDTTIAAWIETHYPCRTDSSDDTDRPVGDDPRTLIVKDWNRLVGGSPVPKGARQEATDAGVATGWTVSDGLLLKKLDTKDGTIGATVGFTVFDDYSAMLFDFWNSVL
jgi:hypothetical protein